MKPAKPAKPTKHKTMANTHIANSHLAGASASGDLLAHNAASSKASVTGVPVTRMPCSLRALLLGCAVWPFMHAPTQSCLQEDQLSAYRELLRQTQECLGNSHSCSRGLALMTDVLTDIVEHCRREGSQESPTDCLPAEAEHQTALTQLAVERTRLYRGVSATGPTPPYEAEWLSGQPAPAVLLSLTRAYQSSGLAVAAGERPDYVGIELGYYQRLITQEADDEPDRHMLLTLQREFVSEHIGRWVPSYVEVTLPLIQSDFFRGHLLLVRGCVAQEIARLLSHEIACESIRESAQALSHEAVCESTHESTHEPVQETTRAGNKGPD